MIEPFKQFPQALAMQARGARLGPAQVPAMLAHPDWASPRPVVIWMHGRTVNKELDPGRYLRWIRAGIAACAIDLPGHGERSEPDRQRPEGTLGVLRQMIGEIDGVLAALRAPEWNGAFDLTRVAIGGMSAGGMATLRRLCDPHPFTCAAVECTTGNLGELYHPREGRPGWPVRHDPAEVRELDPMEHLAGDGTGGWRAIPLLVLHGEKDRVIPIEGQRRFVEALRARYAELGASPSLVEFRAFPENGSPDEHAGFGKYSNDAKNAQVEFFKRTLRA